MWERAVLALTLLAIDPKGLGGMVIRARCGPVRDAFAECFTAMAHPLLKLHPGMDDDALFGGLDLTETLTRGTVVLRNGIIGRDGTAILTMAERCESQIAARLSMALDGETLPCLIALDEGADADEHTPQTLCERLAFYVDLNMPLSDVGLLPDASEIEEARAILGSVILTKDAYETVVGLCAKLGINTQRAPLFALRAARAHAALNDRSVVNADDIETAAAF